MNAWGTNDVIIQQFITPKSSKPSLYRFYMNTQNIYKAECILKTEGIKQN